MMVLRSADAEVERVPDGAGELGLLVVEQQADAPANLVQLNGRDGSHQSI